jgi:hypothetical protein
MGDAPMDADSAPPKRVPFPRLDDRRELEMLWANPSRDESLSAPRAQKPDAGKRREEEAA